MSKLQKISIKGFLDELNDFLEPISFKESVSSLEDDLGVSKIAVGSKPTGLSHVNAREVLASAYKKLFNREPSDGELDFGLATAFVETRYGRAGGQFARWAAQGKYNWGALETNRPGPEKTLQAFKNAGLHVTKEKGTDAKRPVYFYLFPNDFEAAQAFLMSWGRADTLKAAASGSPHAVAKAMKNHGYYEGFWVPPGNPRNYKMPPFKEATSAAEAERNNVRDYASALRGQRSVIAGKGGAKQPKEFIASKPAKESTLGEFLDRFNKFLLKLEQSLLSTANDENNLLVKAGAEDFVVSKIATKTSPLSHDNAREILASEYRKLFNREPSDGELDFGLSTAFFETGYGHSNGFARWAAQGKYNWGALESRVPGEEKVFQDFKNAGLNVTKEKGLDAKRKVYYYLFPSYAEAAKAFLMSWGKDDILKAAKTGSPLAVSKAMKDHNYYEGLWVPPGNPNNNPMPPFKEAGSAAEANRNNIREYSGVLRSKRSVILKGSSKKPESAQPQPTSANPSGLVEFIDKTNKILYDVNSHVSALAQNENNLLVKISAEDFLAKTEYARILQSVLHEELNAFSEIHCDDKNVEMICSLPFNKEDNNMALKEVCSAVSEVFEIATKKIGGCKVSTTISSSEPSKYAKMNIKNSEINRRKFQFKMTKGLNVRK